MLHPDNLQALGQRCDGRTLDRVLVVHVETDRYVALDVVTDAPQAVRQLGCFERGAHRIHAAANVHTHRGRDDGALGRDHRTHGGADAGMHVGHGGNMVMHEGHTRYVGQLVEGL